MDFHALSPHIHVAMHSTFTAPFHINRRVIFDYEIILIEKGQWELIVNHTAYRCRTGDVLLLRPGVPHEIHVGEGVVSQPHIHFDLSYDADSNKRYISFKDAESMSPEERQWIGVDRLSDILPDSPFLTIDDLAFFQSLLFDVIDCFTDKKPLYEIDCKIRMLRLLKYVLKDYVKTVSSRAPDSSMDMVCHYIESNGNHALTLTSLAGQFGYESCYLEKKFKKAMGMPLIRYYHHVRIQAIKDALNAGCSVTESAQRLCFPSIYALSRFFKTHTGMSPTEYIASQRPSADT